MTSSAVFNILIFKLREKILTHFVKSTILFTLLALVNHGNAKKYQTLLLIGQQTQLLTLGLQIGFTVSTLILQVKPFLFHVNASLLIYLVFSLETSRGARPPGGYIICPQVIIICPQVRLYADWLLFKYTCCILCNYITRFVIRIPSNLKQ